MRQAARAEARRLVAHFAIFGAREVETAILQPADTLLDLYGEDIRARAYVTADPVRGEMMLRPDFTVPVAQMHMESAADPARYAYAGEVFRQGEGQEERRESLQAGYEVFGAEPDAADAEVFRAITTAVADLPLRAAIGDVGLLLAAVRGLSTTEARKAALLRHLWRPRRFTALLERFGAPAAPRPDRASDAPEIGLRTREEVEARLAALREDAAAPPIAAREVDLIETLLAIEAPAPEALRRLREVAADLPPIAPAVDRFAARLDALRARGVSVEGLAFEGSFGRTTLEYYDGFVFGLFADARPGLPPVASGGRYDALTRALGQGREVPAVGGVIRPEVVVALRGAA